MCSDIDWPGAVKPSSSAHSIIEVRFLGTTSGSLDISLALIRVVVGETVDIVNGGEQRWCLFVNVVLLQLKTVVGRIECRANRVI